MTMKIYRTNAPPAIMNVTLPGRRAEWRGDYGLVTQVLDKEALTNWMRDQAGLDVSPTNLQAEATEIMTLLKSYENSPPAVMAEFDYRAQAVLKSFSVAGYSSGGTAGAPFLAYAIPIMDVLTCLALYAIHRSLRRGFNEGRAEIRAGRWTPPARDPKVARHAFESEG